MKNRGIYWKRHKTQETLYIGQWHLSPLHSGHLGNSDRSPSHHQLPPSCFPESHRWSEIFSLSKVILVLEKARSCRAPNLGFRGLSHLGDLIFHQKLHRMWYMSGHVVMKLPVTSCPLLQPFLSYCISQLSKNMEIVLLINYLTWRGVFVIDDTFPIKKHKRALTLLGLCHAFFRCGELGDFLWGDWAFASRS